MLILYSINNIVDFNHDKKIITFLVVGYQSLGDGLSDGVDLGNMTTTLDTNSDVNTIELFL